VNWVKNPHGVRITDELMTQIMNWASSNGASRSEAIGRLVELGLTVKASTRTSKPGRLTKGPEEFQDVRVDRPKSKRWFSGGRSKEMSKKPKIDHDYDGGKDKLTITIHRYSLKRKKTRDAIIQELKANLKGAEKKPKKRRTSGQPEAF
jgi:hypothetical protein